MTGESKIAQDNENGTQRQIDWKEKGYWDKFSESRGRTLRVPYNFMEDLLKQDFGKNADKVTAKTILIIGDQENKIRLEDNEKLFDLLKCEKELIILPNTPHVVAKTLENAKTFRKALERVLEF
jgi:dipeptidyl aminopeptidase/acylaminoacyl peptidase